MGASLSLSALHLQNSSGGVSCNSWSFTLRGTVTSLSIGVALVQIVGISRRGSGYSRALAASPHRNAIGPQAAGDPLWSQALRDDAIAAQFVEVDADGNGR